MTNIPPSPNPTTPPAPSQRRVIMIGVVGMTAMLLIALIAVLAARVAFQRPPPAAAPTASAPGKEELPRK
jgi:hypothetical protein